MTDASLSSPLSQFFLKRSVRWMNWSTMSTWLTSTLKFGVQTTTSTSPTYKMCFVPKWVDSHVNCTLVGPGWLKIKKLTGWLPNNSHIDLQGAQSWPMVWNVPYVSVDILSIFLKLTGVASELRMKWGDAAYVHLQILSSGCSGLLRFVMVYKHWRQPNENITPA